MRIYLKVTTSVRIAGKRNCWQVTGLAGSNADGKDCVVDLEIEGNDNSGYHLTKIPSEGYFTADSWYVTKEEALEEAYETYGVDVNAWQEIDENSASG